MRDTGYGIRDTVRDGERTLLNPVSRNLDPDEERRLRWRCRRGLLELDIVLSRFVEQRYATMDSEEREIFDELLDMPDPELWDVITGKRELPHARQRLVLDWLKEV